MFDNLKIPAVTPKKVAAIQPKNATNKVLRTPTIDALKWVENIGGLEASIEKSKRNLNIIEKFCEKHNWIDFLASSSDIRSNTSVCLTLRLTEKEITEMIKTLER